MKVTLSPREDQVRRLLMEHRSVKEMATVMGITAHSIKEFKRRMQEKTGASGRSGLMKYFAANPIPRDIGGLEMPSIEGYWISRFSFKNYVVGSGNQSPRYRSASQIDVELIQVSKQTLTHEGYNIDGRRSDHKEPYLHNLQILAEGRTVRGFWHDKPPSECKGCFQLYIQNEGESMEGAHIGNTTNHVIKSGDWVWLKLRSTGSENINSRVLRSYSELDALIETSMNDSRPLYLADLYVR